MRARPSLRICCPHLEDTKEGSRLRSRWLTLRGDRPIEVRLDGGETLIIVRFCDACSARVGADDGCIDSLRLAALTMLHRDLHVRLEKIVEALSELAPLSTRPKA